MKKPTRQKLALVRMPRPEASKELLDVLEELRTLALSGDITAFGFVASMTKRGCLSYLHWGKGGETVTMLGEVECLRQRICDRIREVNDGRI